MKVNSSENQALTPDDTCAVFVYNPHLIEKVKGELREVSTIAVLFKTLGDESRCTILLSLTRASELCVCDLSQITGLALPTVSHHLRKLREQGLVASRREGKLVFYRLEGKLAKTLLQAASKAPVKI